MSPGDRTPLSFWVISARMALAICILFTAWGAFAPEHSYKPHLFPWDKAEHFSAFFSLTACAIVAFPRMPLLWVGAALSGSGALIEVVQGLPWVHRDSSITDWAADTIAVCAVMGVIFATRLRRADALVPSQS